MKVTSIPVMYQGTIYEADPVDMRMLRGSISQSGGDGIALQAIDKMASLRQSFESSTGSLTQLLEYDSLLTHLSRALMDAPVSIMFKWKIPVEKKKTSIVWGETKSVTTEMKASPSIAFERTHVLHNAGVLTFRTAASLASSANTVSDAIPLFTKAAGIFAISVELADKCGQSAQAEDSRLMHTLSRGYAQLGMYCKAVNANSSIVLRAKLAGGAVDILSNTAKVLTLYSEIVAHAAAGLVCEEDLEYGNALSHYKRCRDILEGHSEIKSDGLASELKQKYKQLSKDNDVVYFQQVPDNPPALEKRVCVNDTAYELCNEDSPFKSIVPTALRSAMLKYQQQSGRIVADTKNMIPQFTAEGDGIIQNVNLRSLENKVDQVEHIPSDLRITISRLKGMSSPDDVMSKLEAFNSQLKKIRELKDEISASLKRESEEDQQMAQKYGKMWDRKSSAEVTQEYQDSLKKIDRFIEEGRDLYSRSKTMLLKSTEKIKLMIQGEETLSGTLPKSNTNLKQMVGTMIDYAEKWNELKSVREQSVNRIIELQSKHQKTLLEDLRGAPDTNQFVDGLLSEFTPLTGAVQNTLNEQSSLMDAVEQLNNEINKITSETSGTRGSVCAEYNQIGSEYISASLQLVDLMVNIESVDEETYQLKKKVDEFTSTRHNAIPELEKKAQELMKAASEPRQNNYPTSYPTSESSPGYMASHPTSEKPNSQSSYPTSYPNSNQNTAQQYPTSYPTSQPQTNQQYPSSYPTSYPSSQPQYQQMSPQPQNIPGMAPQYDFNGGVSVQPPPANGLMQTTQMYTQNYPIYGMPPPVMGQQPFGVPIDPVPNMGNIASPYPLGSASYGAVPPPINPYGMQTGYPYGVW